MSGLENSQIQLKAKNNTVEFYFARHAESCSNISHLLGKMYHPPLSYKGIQQAVNLGINNKIIDMDFDKYYCSPSLRTIMTACLALRRKSLNKSITLTLNPYLIEHQNTAQYGTYVGISDQQNSIVQKENLDNMINYIKSWFQQKYFDNYIDYEFVHIMYDLVALLHLNNHLDKYKNTIKKLLAPIKENRSGLLHEFIYLLNEIELLNKNKIIINYKTGNIYDIYDNILLFLNDNDRTNNFSIYADTNIENILEYSKIKIQLLMISTTSYYFMNNIKIEYFIPHTSVYPEYSVNINHFIEHEMSPNLQSDEKIKKLLCFTHGEALKHHFKFKTKLENTEIVHYNTNDKIIRIKNNNIVINEKLVEDICGDPITGKQMFKIIKKYFNDINYKVTTDNDIDKNFKVNVKEEEDKIKEEQQRKLEEGWEVLVGEELVGGYKHKYLKYKYKYLNYKKIKLNH